MSGVGTRPSSGRKSGWLVWKVREMARLRGPVCGERPWCCASIWYCGLPTRPAATGDGLAAAAGDAAGFGAATGLAAGLAAGDAAAAAAGAVAGETDATGWIAGGAVGLGVAAGGLVTVIGWGGLWHATRSVVAASARPSAQRVRT